MESQGKNGHLLNYVTDDHLASCFFWEHVGLHGTQSTVGIPPEQITMLCWSLSHLVPC
jgi:hypothetical protein